jgi:hypothetical protein
MISDKESRMKDELQARLALSADSLEAINDLLQDPEVDAISRLVEIVHRHGTPEEINRKASQAGSLPDLLKQVERIRPDYLAELQWLGEQSDKGAFITVGEYRRRIHGERAGEMDFDESHAVTLEISSCHYFPWLMQIARLALERGELMPGRFVTTRKMREQEKDGDLPAFAAAMQIIGASYVEQMDTLGTDGANLHVRSNDTLVGFFGGMGMPNDYPYRWVDEFLYYYTTYGVRQVLCLSPGALMVAFLLHRLGVNIEFKVSVSMGNDNPLSALWVLLTAKLFARQDGNTPLAGFNWSNSVTNATILSGAQIRRKLGFEESVRFEHHVTEARKGIVAQPYLRRQEIAELARSVPNLSGKHEGGDPEIEMLRERPSDIEDYDRALDEVIASGDWEALTQNFLDKFEALNRTARLLTEQGQSFVAARRLHHCP